MTPSRPARQRMSNVQQYLQQTFPPDAVIHVGAGAGIGELHEWRNVSVPIALLIDASEERLHWSEPLRETHPDWHVRGVTLAEQNAEADYFCASNPDEDGLVQPETLARLWPNLRSRETRTVAVQRLDHLLTEADLQNLSNAPNVWAIIDCFPSLGILKGAGEYIDRWTVIWVRVIVGRNDVAKSSLDQIETFLASHGFRNTLIVEGNNPAVGHALFVRDWNRVARLKTQANESILSRLDVERTALEQEKSTLTARQSSLEKQIAEITSARDTETKARTALEQEKSTLAARQDSLEKQVAELTAARDAEAGARAGLEQEKSTLAARQDSLENQVRQKELRIGQLEAELSERDARQHLLNDEITRAEAQIDLIKDVLLRESGL